jgi:hypothetical protein
VSAAEASLRSYDPRPRSATELTDAAFWLLRSEPRAVLLLGVMPAIAASAIDIVLGKQVRGTSFAIPFALGRLPIRWALIAVPALALAMVFAARLLGRSLTLESAIRTALSRAPAAIGSSLAAGVSVYLGVALFVAPGLWALMAFLLSNAALAFEPVSGVRALARSRALMYGHKGRLLLPVLLPLAANVVLGLSIARYSRIAWEVIYAAVTVYLGALAFVVYVDVRCREEAFGIEVLATRVDAGTSE